MTVQAIDMAEFPSKAQEEFASVSKCVLNGTAVDLHAKESVASLLARRGIQGIGVAVALNEAVVPRSAWSTTHIGAGDRLEVLSIAPGG